MPTKKPALDKSVYTEAFLEQINTLKENHALQHVYDLLLSKIIRLHKEKNKIDEYIEKRKYPEIRDNMSKYSDIDLDYLNSFEEFNPATLDSQIKELEEKYPSIKFIKHSGNQSLYFSVDLNLHNKNIKTGEFWTLQFENFPIHVTFTSKENILHPRIIKLKTDGKIKHPYFDIYGEFIHYAIFTKAFDTNKFFYDIIDNIIKQLSVFNSSYIASSMENFIGRKCCVCEEYSKKNMITCPKTGMILHANCGKVINGTIYNPAMVKECYVCKKDKVDWIIKSDVVICGACDVN
ncbi:MAG TPA: hypothetical protein PKX31_00050 [Chitinophagaceae bacterium]|nr:hypothetical protein [Chitinophagaceae bacterium]